MQSISIHVASNHGITNNRNGLPAFFQAGYSWLFWASTFLEGGGVLLFSSNGPISAYPGKNHNGTSGRYIYKIVIDSISIYHIHYPYIGYIYIIIYIGELCVHTNVYYKAINPSIPVVFADKSGRCERCEVSGMSSTPSARSLIRKRRRQKPCCASDGGFNGGKP